MATVKIGFQSVPGDSIWAVQPAAGEEWCLNTASTWGDGTNAGVAQLYDGTIVSSSGIAQPQYEIGDGDLTHTCLRDAKVFVDNATYFRMKNHNASPKYCSYSALELGITVRADIASITLNSGWAVQPAAGEEWLVTTVATRGDDVNPGYANIYDGTNSGAKILDPTLTYPAGIGGKTMQVFRDGKVIIDNSSYLWIYNEDESTENLAYSAMLLP